VEARSSRHLLQRYGISTRDNGRGASWEERIESPSKGELIALSSTKTLETWEKTLMKHDEEPVREEEELTPELAERAEGILQSEYARYIREMQPEILGKEVASSLAGSSGFLLFFSDGTWAASYLEGERLAYQLGSGTPPAEVIRALSSSEYGHASEPLAIDRPYAEEPCSIAEQVASCHGQPVVGLAFGADCFNFCFPEGWELDTMIVSDPEGRTALRVFWEQW
jgi:hypothetical protein